MYAGLILMLLQKLSTYVQDFPAKIHVLCLHIHHVRTKGKFSLNSIHSLTFSAISRGPLPQMIPVGVAGHKSHYYDQFDQKTGDTM